MVMAEGGKEYKRVFQMALNNASFRKLKEKIVCKNFNHPKTTILLNNYRQL